MIHGFLGRGIKNFYPNLVGLSTTKEKSHPSAAVRVKNEPLGEMMIAVPSSRKAFW
jgi:hypothetical protein